VVEEQTKARGINRYEAIIATLVGVCALAVSAYTAHVQRQQVRATVWPILEYNTSNEPHIRFTLENKGMGPAIVRHVKVTVDDQPVINWYEALQKLIGPGKHNFAESTMSGHVLSAGESMDIMAPHNADSTPLTYDKANPLWEQMNKERNRVAIEICYCSTLGECWTLRSGRDGTTTVETSTCPGPSATSFQQ
jgi:hypothetical protein